MRFWSTKSASEKWKATYKFLSGVWNFWPGDQAFLTLFAESGQRDALVMKGLQFFLGNHLSEEFFLGNHLSEELSSALKVMQTYYRTISVPEYFYSVKSPI